MYANNALDTQWIEKGRQEERFIYSVDKTNQTFQALLVIGSCVLIRHILTFWI